MGLSCGCDFDRDDAEWWYEHHNDFDIYSRPRATRCRSCHAPIKTGDECVRITRGRSPRNDIEERIHGDEVWLAPWHYCASCGEIFLNLVAYGYCLDPGESMREQLREHWELTGFTPTTQAPPSQRPEAC